MAHRAENIHSLGFHFKKFANPGLRYVSVDPLTITKATSSLKTQTKYDFSLSLQCLSHYYTGKKCSSSG